VSAESGVPYLGVYREYRCSVGTVCVVGIRNYLVEGVSGSGKTCVAEELERRGFAVIHGDRSLAYHGNPDTGEPVEKASHFTWIWSVDEVRSLAADRSDPVLFFCGGSRNHNRFLDVFDEVFVLDVDAETIEHRLAGRPGDEWGKHPSELALALRLNETKEDLPAGTVIDATQPLANVVDDILGRVDLS
jgi:gluconate kinase